MSAKHILVTGGAGFIGTNLCGALSMAGHDLTVLDNLSTGNAPQTLSFDFIETDICDPLPSIDCDLVVNLACPASPVHYQSDPIATTKTSVLGAINVLEFCERTGARLIHASTSEVYGDPQVHPQREDYVGHVNPIGKRACYDEGKRCAESLIYDYVRMRDVNADVIRIFNTYGPHMQINDGRVVSNFVVQALKGEPITVYGDGSQTRSMCFVGDLVAGIEALIARDTPLGGPVNLGNPEEISVIDFARKVISATGSTSEIVFRDLPEDDPVKRRPDITRAKDLLNWQPQVSLDDGLSRTIDYFADQLRNLRAA